MPSGRTGTWPARTSAGGRCTTSKASPADPNRIYASQSTSWFGQLIQRSDDGGATWQPVGNDFRYAGVPGTHQWYDGTPHPWEFARVWHREPSLTDPDVVYAGVEDAALFRSDDAGTTCALESPGCASTGQGHHCNRKRKRMCLHTILLDRNRREPARRGHLCRRRVPHRRPATMAAARECGLRRGIPDPDAEVGRCVHHIAMHPSTPMCCSCKALGRDAPATMAT